MGEQSTVRDFIFRALTRVVFFGLVIQAGGCALSRKVDYEEVDFVQAETELSAAQLLSIGIVVFDPGATEGDEDVFPDVRKAEARYMPYHLKNTLERTGQWGAVWVLPERSEAVDLVVWGRIYRSDGLDVELQVAAWDSTGKEWLNREYEMQFPQKAYSKYRDFREDPYQSVYNMIANDLLEIRQKTSLEDLDNIRQVTELRYASDLVPVAFKDYIEKDDDGIFQIRRLPANDDPMVERMRAVQEREYYLADTLNEYYASLYYDISGPYENWRKMSREEILKYRDLKRSARIRQLMGFAAILGAIAYEGGGGSNGAITNTAIVGGIAGVTSGFKKSAQANEHKDELMELGESFDSEAAEVVVELEGQTRRLSGTAEQRYKEWRKLLRDIYTAETGILLQENASQGSPSSSGS